MPISHQVSSNEFPAAAAGDFLTAVQADDESLVYFLCNVGDGDSQVLLLPRNPVLGYRQAMVVDASSATKVRSILDWASGHALLAPAAAAGADPERDIALVVATHPHGDHIRGMSSVLQRYRERISEFWDPGYFHTSGAYHNMMSQIATNPDLVYSQPTSGYRRWLGEVVVTVLGPSIHLRNRFDSYGVEINDASLSLQLEFPTPRVMQRDSAGNQLAGSRPTVLILGADAQTLSWSYVLTDFPRLRKSNSAAAAAIGAAQGDRDLLRAGVHKVSHHASKNGVNLELAARIGASYTLVSSVRSGGSYGFPHAITQEILREATSPLAASGTPHDPNDDPSLGLYYTGDADTNNAELGTIALIIRGHTAEMWRFGDRPSDPLDLDGASRRAANTARV